MVKMRFTKTSVRSLPFVENGQKLFWDEELKGFGLVVGKGSKSYVAQRDVNGRTVRVTIGRSDLYTADKARDVARRVLLEMSEGRNPNKERRNDLLKRKYLISLFNDYIQTKKEKLAKGTIVGYKDIMENHVKDWWNKELSEISHQDIVSRFEEITLRAGKGAAGHSMRLLRALYNYAAIEDENLSNPVEILTKKKLWHVNKRRQNIIKNSDLNQWFSFVCSLENDSFRDALIVILFTGLRKNEAFSLTWSDVDIKNKSILLSNTKNKESLILPMNSVIYEILSARKSSARSKIWVFDSDSRSGHIVDAASTIRRIKRETDVSDFSLHALRRTFITAAERLDISPYTIKALVNHKLGNDVTAGYVIRDVERLRKSSESIAMELKRIIAS